MPSAVASIRALPWVFFALLAACTRSSVASFVPVLDVGVRLTRSSSYAQHLAQRDAQAFATEVYVWFSFRPLSPAASLPLVSDASGLLIQTPCDESDVACLDEVSESESELSAVREDVP